MHVLHPAAWPRGLSTADGEAALLFITTVGCGACARVRALLSAGLDVPFPLRVFELDAAEGSNAVQALRVFHLPALFLYRDGQFHAPVEAEATAAALGRSLVDAWNAAPQEEP